MSHAVTSEFLERQRIARGNKPTDRAIMDAFAEIAETWRHLAATMDRKRHISTLREAVAEDLKAVSEFDEDMVNNLKALSDDFQKHVSSDPVLSEAANKSNKTVDSRWSQKALQSLQMFHQLKDEASIRYAQALIDREIAVLELADVMDQHECDVAERELQTVDAALAAAQQDLQDCESDLARMQNDGPALPRKRDALDRANKEAEHRERLMELQTHIADCRTRIDNEKAFGSAAQKRRTDAVSDLAEGRQELTEYLDKRQSLDRACHAVLQAQERDKGQELTDAFVDARIKAVWQVVEGVADAIRTLHPRYAPGSDSKETNRHARCTALAKTLSSELDDRVRVWWEDLAKLRRRASDMALVDLGRILEHVVMEAIRRKLEGKAAEAREAATLNLLQELEREEQAKKAAQTKKAKKKAGKAKKAEEAKMAAAAAAAEAKSVKSVEDKAEEKNEADEINAERQREMEYEAALEKRRLELQKEKEKQEAELRKIARDVSFGDEAGGSSPSSSAPASSSKKKAAGQNKKSSTVEEEDGGFQTMKPKASRAAGNNPPVATPPPPPPPPPGKPGHGHGHNHGHAQLTIKTDGRECEMRIITYYGDWNCHCGKINRLWDTCACGQIPPCRDWVRGRCTYGERCRFGHPPFELPDSLPRPKSPIAKPGADAIIYKTARNPEVTAAATAKHTGGHHYERHENQAGPPTAKSAPKPAIVATSASTASANTGAAAAAVGAISGGPAIASSASAAPAPFKPAPWASKDAGSMGGIEPVSGSLLGTMTQGGLPLAQLNTQMSSVGLMSQMAPLSPTGPSGVMQNPPMSPTGVGFGLSMQNPQTVGMQSTMGMGSVQQTQAQSLGGFGLFGDANSLMGSIGVLDGGMSTMGMQTMSSNMAGSSTVDENLVNRAFAGLDLGSGVSPGAQSTIGQQGGFFDDSSFMGMQQQSMNVQQNSQQQMHYQSDMYAAPFQSSPSSMQQMGYGGGVGVGGQQSPIGNFGVGMQSMQSMQSMGVGMTASNDANNTNNQQQANDDWNDLQLQLPSDLLGGDSDLNWGVPTPNPNHQF